MAGIDDNVAVIGDWASPLNPSPRTFFSSLLSDDFSSRPFLGPMSENGGSKEPLPGSEQQKMSMNSEQEETEFGSGASRDQFSEPSVLSGQRLSSRGSLSERMAARAGFNAPRLNTARIRSSNISSSSALEVRSPYLTIPPGLSPTTLLDSPVFLSNSLAQPSPTTGKIPLAPCNNRSSMTVSAAPDKNKEHPLEDIDTASFVFKPHTESSSSYLPNPANRESSSSYFSNAANKADSAIDHQQSFLGIGTPLQSEHTIHTQNEVTEVHLQNQPEFHPPSDFSKSTIGKDSAGNIMSTLTMSCTVAGTADHSPPPDDQEEGEGDQRESACMVGGGPSEDGYNWRKYGQKQVKGSEYPRSYYKCTHPNCPVKKKVERSHEGHITEIIYKGKHNHPKPPPNRRSAIGSSHPSNDMDVTEQHGARTTFDGETVWGSVQGGPALAGSDWRHDGVEAGTSASVVTEFHDPSTSMRVQNGLQMDAVDVSSTLSNDDDEDDRGTHGSVSLGHDDEGDESESKRRKADASLMELSGATRAIREPRVVVQTTSEVDILDDGYRWRKYGQKVVKGNPNPRSYYKCTNAGCSVRKHVERASHDLKSVITTYEGKHNHDVPAARNSSHVNSGLSSMGPAPAAQPQIHRPESSQAHDSMPRFDGPTSLSTFGMPGRPPLGSAVGFSFGMNSPGLANLAMASLGPAQGRMPLLPHLHSYLGQQRNVNEVGFMMPKGEPKEEPILDSNLPIVTGSGYHQMMSRLPLGRQL